MLTKVEIKARNDYRKARDMYFSVKNKSGRSIDNGVNIKLVDDFFKKYDDASKIYDRSLEQRIKKLCNNNLALSGASK